MNPIFKKGDCVVVKQGVKEPDLEKFEMSGWHGRVVEIDTKSDINNILITIEWDSATLNQIPTDYIEQSEIEGLDWEKMILYESDLEKANPRDKSSDVKKTQAKISDKHYWASLGDEGKRIAQILENVNPYDEMKCLQKWVEHLDKMLTLPVQATVEDSEDNFLIKRGDIVVIKSLPHIVDMYGVIASVRLNGKKYEFPLCDLEVIDKTKADYQLIDDYRTWFANR